MSVAVAYAIVILVWATTPLGIQWSALELGPITALLIRTLGGLALGLSIIGVLRLPLPLSRRAWTSYVAGGLGFGVGMLLVYFAALWLPSGMISVLFGLAPLVSGVLAAWWLGVRELTPVRVTALVIAIAGLAWIFRAELGLGAERLPGFVLMLGSLSCFCASGVWVKRVAAAVHPLVQTMGALLVTLPILLAVWWASDEPASIELLAGASARAWGAVIYLAVFGSVIGFVSYFHLLRRVAPGQVALVTLITPVLALLLGATLNDEQIDPAVLGGALMILAGLGLYIVGPAIEKRTV